MIKETFGGIMFACLSRSELYPKLKDHVKVYCASLYRGKCATQITPIILVIIKHHMLLFFLEHVWLKNIFKEQDRF